MEPMYPSKSGSPSALTTAGISDSDTSITFDVNVLTASPGIATLGVGALAEVVIFTSNTGTTISGVTRGASGTIARAWPVDTPISRRYTSHDHDAFRANIGSVLARPKHAYLGVESAYLPADNPSTLEEVDGSTSYAGYDYLAFDDTTPESAVWRVPVPEYDGGNIAVTIYTKPSTTPLAPVSLQFDILTVGLSSSEEYTNAVVVDTGVNLVQSMGTTNLSTEVLITSATINPANVSTDDIMVLQLTRDVTSDNLVGDGELLGVLIEYGVV